MIVGILILVIALLALAWLFLILPRISNTPDMELLRVDYAHRGLWNETIPENSLAAFAYATARGYGMELDIQPSRDGRIMVFHDGNLRRMCGVDKKVCELTYDELRALRLGGTDQVIPTLEEVLATVRGRVPLLIEVKGERADHEFLTKASELLDAYGGPFCVESFSPLILRWFRCYRPGYARGQLVTKMTNKDRKGASAVNFLLTHMMLNVLSRPDFIAVSGKIRRRPAFLLVHKLLGRPSFVWTVRRPEDRITCRKEGSFVIFEGFEPKRPKN